MRTRERVVLLSICALACLGWLLGLVVRLPASTSPDLAQQALDAVRVLATTALAVVLVLGPGLVWRTRAAARELRLGFMALPGLGLLVAAGCVTWALAGAISARWVCVATLTPVLGWVCAGVLRAEPENLLEAEERRALVIAGAALGIAVARSLWSLGPAGELGRHTIYRTLEVGDRIDSSIPYYVVRLLAGGVSPFSAVGQRAFFPLSFSDRGPLAGIASGPVVLLAGGRPTSTTTNAWLPFDPAGFMAYRLAMMSFACTAFLSLWTLTRRLTDARAARFALLLAASTPFLVHEVWFTWPKLFAATFVLLAAVELIDGRPLRTGLLLGVGYLVHPLVLLSLPALGLLALWPLARPRWRHPNVRGALVVAAGAALFLVAWRLINVSHYTQSNFLDYITEAGRKKYLANLFLHSLGPHPTGHGRLLLDLLMRQVGGHPAVTVSDWLTDRFVSLSNTLVPLRLFFVSAHDPSINVINPSCYPACAGHSPGVVHFFFQYWNTLPFGIGIVFFVPLLISLWRAGRRWRWPVFVAVVVPFVVFAFYWGDASTGMLREGLHPWVLTLLLVVAAQQRAEGYRWLRVAPMRALLALRSGEVLLVALVPTLATAHRAVDHRFALTDILALSCMVGLCGYLAAAIWRERPDRANQLGGPAVVSQDAPSRISQAQPS